MTVFEMCIVLAELVGVALMIIGMTFGKDKTVWAGVAVFLSYVFIAIIVTAF